MSKKKDKVVYAVMDADTAISLLEEYNEARSKGSEAGQEASQVFKRAEKTYGMHRGATKVAMMLKLWPAEKRSDWLRTFAQLQNLYDLHPETDLVDQADAA